MGMDGRRRAALAVTARRGELGLTQQELADKADVSVKTIGNLESRGIWPWARTRGRIEAALGWAAGELDRVAIETPARRELTPHAKAVIRRDLGDEAGDRAIAYIERREFPAE